MQGPYLLYGQNEVTHVCGSCEIGSVVNVKYVRLSIAKKECGAV